MNLRILLNLAVALSFILLPWWITVMVAISMVILVENPIEIVIYGVIHDSIFNLGSAGVYGYSATLLGAVLVIVSHVVKPRLVNISQASRRFQMASADKSY